MLPGGLEHVLLRRLHQFCQRCGRSWSFRQILKHAIEFGGLAQQKEAWSSWVPSWNRANNHKSNAQYLQKFTRRNDFSANIRGIADIHSVVSASTWKDDTIKPLFVYGSRAISIQGSIYRISDTQTDSTHPDAISFFKTVLGSQCVDQSSVTSKYMIVWLVTAALEFVTPKPSKARLYQDTFFIVISSYNNERAGCETDYTTIAIWVAMLTVLGLPTDDYDEELFELNEDRFVLEAKRLLQSLYAFSYEHEGSFTFGLALAQVEPGDLIFRTVKAIGSEGDWGGPSLCGLVIRPYHEAGSAGPAPFRLVVMCIDYYPDIQDPEMVDVILV